VSVRTFFVCVLAGLAVSTGCSVDGTVTIRNESGSEFVGLLEGRGIALSGNESIEKTIKVGTQVLLFGPDEKTVVFEGEGCTRTPLRQDVVVRKDDVQVVTIEPDAVCVTYRNDSQYDVTEVYMRDADAVDWGSNLVEILYPSTTLTIRVAPGIYDFLMVDECADSTGLDDSIVIAGDRRDVTHRGLVSCPGRAAAQR